MLPYFRVSAFARDPYGGNPAGVCLCETWPEDDAMQAAAAENGLAETAFVLPRADGDWDLRWFTPALEIDLCGHATLATAHVLWRERGVAGDRLRLHTKCGALTVERDEPRLVLDFPSRPAEPIAPPAGLAGILGAEPVAVGRSRDLLVELQDEATVRGLAPDGAGLADLDALGVIVTARGCDVSFVSRFFAPRAGIDEDPVTGSAHCTLVPWWAEKLGRTELQARQVSRRGGELTCELRGDRVRMGGEAVTFQRGEILV